MYESFYGLKEKPFALTPDPQFLYFAPPHRKALTMLEYSLASEAAFCLISGEVGSGKTTLIRHLLTNIEQTTTVGLISNTSFNFGRLLQWICMSFGLEHSGKDEVALYELFTRFLIDEYAKGHKVVLIVDEAQNLGAVRLEELRVLSNINADKHLLLQTILVGQPELRGTHPHAAAAAAGAAHWRRLPHRRPVGRRGPPLHPSPATRGRRAPEPVYAHRHHAGLPEQRRNSASHQSVLRSGTRLRLR